MMDDLKERVVRLEKLIVLDLVLTAAALGEKTIELIQNFLS